MLNATNNNNKPSPLPEDYPGIHPVQSGPPQCHSLVKTVNTNRYLSDTVAREYLRWAILEAFRAGRLACRSVTIDEEKVYLSQQNKNPRPAYMMLEGCVLAARPITLGIMDPEPLACYKRNAYTRFCSF